MAKTSGYYPETASPLLSPPNDNPYSSVPPPPLQSYYTGIPTSPPDTFIFLPVHLCLRRRRTLRFRSLLSSSCLLTIFFLTLLLLSLFFLYPSDPDLSVARLHLSRLRVTTSPSVALTISIGLDLKIRNPDFFSIDYTYLNSTVLYRGRRLGSVTSEGGHVRARGVSYVQADLNLDAVRIIDDVFYLIEDIASGIIPIETETQIVGDVHLFFLNVPVQGKISCSVGVNPQTQSIVKQDCYPVDVLLERGFTVQTVYHLCAANLIKTKDHVGMFLLSKILERAPSTSQYLYTWRSKHIACMDEGYAMIVTKRDCWSIVLGCGSLDPWRERNGIIFFKQAS